CRSWPRTPGPPRFRAAARPRSSRGSTPLPRSVQGRKRSSGSTRARCLSSNRTAARLSRRNISPIRLWCVDERDQRRGERELGLFFVIALRAVMWVVEVIDQLDNSRLESHGIQPRDVGGLEGIVTAPFLHAGWGHLIGNTVPFVVLGLAIAFTG